MKAGAHHCEACGSKAKVVDMAHWDGVTNRVLECPCGERWTSAETRCKRLAPAATGSSGFQPVAAGSNRLQPVARKPPPDALQPPVATHGGVGGGLSSGQAPASDPDPNASLLSEPRARERKRRRDAETPAFAAFYAAFPRKEARPRAWSAWVSQGCEMIADAVMAGLAAWQAEFTRRAAKDPGTVPHPASWLNARQWQDKPPAPPAKDARCAFHLNWTNNRRKPPGGWYAGCPVCKEAQAALGTRQGDAAPVRDLVAETEARLAAQRAVRPASRDELEALRQQLDAGAWGS